MCNMCNHIYITLNDTIFSYSLVVILGHGYWLWCLYLESRVITTHWSISFWSIYQKKMDSKSLPGVAYTGMPCLCFWQNYCWWYKDSALEITLSTYDAHEPFTFTYFNSSSWFTDSDWIFSCCIWWLGCHYSKLLQCVNLILLWYNKANVWRIMLSVCFLQRSFSEITVAVISYASKYVVMERGRKSWRKCSCLIAGRGLYV